MSWLITTAWDTGCKHAQHGHHAQALAFLAAAIELMDYCDAFKDTKEVQSLPCLNAASRQFFGEMSSQCCSGTALAPSCCGYDTI